MVCMYSILWEIVGVVISRLFIELIVSFLKVFLVFMMRMFLFLLGR